eukprot:284819006_5
MVSFSGRRKIYFSRRNRVTYRNRELSHISSMTCAAYFSENISVHFCKDCVRNARQHMQTVDVLGNNSQNVVRKQVSELTTKLACCNQPFIYERSASQASLPSSFLAPVPAAGIPFWLTVLIADKLPQKTVGKGRQCFHKFHRLFFDNCLCYLFRIFLCVFSLINVLESPPEIISCGKPLTYTPRGPRKSAIPAFVEIPAPERTQDVGEQYELIEPYGQYLHYAWHTSRCLSGLRDPQIKQENGAPTALMTKYRSLPTSNAR